MGWDKPLDIKIIWHTSLLKANLYREAGSGPLAQAMRVTEHKDHVNIQNDKPYAVIQDRGGVIPPYQSEGVMRFKVGGQVVFARSRGSITIKPKNYVDKAVDRWYKKIGVEWK